MSTSQTSTEQSTVSTKTETHTFLEKCQKKWRSVSEAALKQEKRTVAYVNNKEAQASQYISGFLSKDTSDKFLKIPHQYVISGSDPCLMIDMGTVATTPGKSYASVDEFIAAQNSAILVPQDIVVELTGDFPAVPAYLTLARVIDAESPTNTTAINIGEFRPENPIVVVSSSNSFFDGTQSKVGSVDHKLGLVGQKATDDTHNVARFHYLLDFPAQVLHGVALIASDMEVLKDGQFAFGKSVVTPIVIIPMKKVDATNVAFQPKKTWKTHSINGTSSSLYRHLNTEDKSLVTLVFASVYFAEEFAALCTALCLGGSIITPKKGIPMGFYLIQTSAALAALKYLDQLNNEFFGSGRKVIVISFQGAATFNQNFLHANVSFDNVPLKQKDDSSTKYPHYALQPGRKFHSSNHGWSTIIDIIKKSQSILRDAYAAILDEYKTKNGGQDNYEPPTAHAQSLIADYIATNAELCDTLTAVTVPYNTDDHPCVTKQGAWPAILSSL